MLPVQPIPTPDEYPMTPAELTAILDAIVIQLADIMSFGLGGLTGIAFVITANKRWL